MSVNGYQETVIHDLHERLRGESDVFRVDYPDGRQICRKEYIGGLNYDILKDYHALHNYLSGYTFDFKTSFELDGQHISTARFKVLSLGDIVTQAISLENKNPVCISEVPYVGGDYFQNLIYGDDYVLKEMKDLYDLFLYKLSKVAPLYLPLTPLVESMMFCNVKFSVEGDVITATVTDICATIRGLYTLCDKAKIDLLKTLQS